MLTLEKPFSVRSIETHKRSVCDRGERPIFPCSPQSGIPVVPRALQTVLEHSWEANVMKRWSMAHCCDHLEDLIWEWEHTSPLSLLSKASTAESTTPRTDVFCDYENIIIDITNDIQARYDCVAQRMWGCLGPTTPEQTVAEWKEAPTLVLDNQRSSMHMAQSHQSSTHRTSLRISSMDHVPRSSVLPMSSLLQIKERLSTVKDEDEETEGDSMANHTIPEESTLEGEGSSGKGEEVSLDDFAETTSASEASHRCHSQVIDEVLDYTRSTSTNLLIGKGGHDSTTSLDAEVRIPTPGPIENEWKDEESPPNQDLSVANQKEKITETTNGTVESSRSHDSDEQANPDQMSYDNLLQQEADKNTFSATGENSYKAEHPESTTTDASDTESVHHNDVNDGDRENELKEKHSADEQSDSRGTHPTNGMESGPSEDETAIGESEGLSKSNKEASEQNSYDTNDVKANSTSQTSGEDRNGASGSKGNDDDVTIEQDVTQSLRYPPPDSPVKPGMDMVEVSDDDACSSFHLETNVAELPSVTLKGQVREEPEGNMDNGSKS